MTQAVEVLHAEFVLLEASAAKPTQEITDPPSAVAELGTAVAVATKTREDEKAMNAETIADAQD